MKNALFLFFVFTLIIIASCSKDELTHSAEIPISNVEPISIEKAKSWFDSNRKIENRSLLETDTLTALNVSPIWDQALLSYYQDSINIVIVPFEDEPTQLDYNGYTGAKLIFYNDSIGDIQSYILVYQGEEYNFKFREKYSVENFSGIMMQVDDVGLIGHVIHISSGIIDSFYCGVELDDILNGFNSDEEIVIRGGPDCPSAAGRREGWLKKALRDILRYFRNGSGSSGSGGIVIRNIYPMWQVGGFGSKIQTFFPSGNYGGRLNLPSHFNNDLFNFEFIDHNEMANRLSNGLLLDQSEQDCIFDFTDPDNILNVNDMYNYLSLNTLNATTFTESSCFVDLKCNYGLTHGFEYMLDFWNLSDDLREYCDLDYYSDLIKTIEFSDESPFSEFNSNLASEHLTADDIVDLYTGAKYGSLLSSGNPALSDFWPLMVPTCKESFPVTDISGAWYCGSGYIKMMMWCELNPTNLVTACIKDMCIQVPKQNSFGDYFNSSVAKQKIADAMDKAREDTFWLVCSGALNLDADAKVTLLDFFRNNLAEEFQVALSSVSVSPYPCNNGAEFAFYANRIPLTNYCLPGAGEYTDEGTWYCSN